MRPASKYPPELLRYEEWPAIDPEMIPEKHQQRHGRLKAAVEAACDGVSKAMIFRKWGIPGSQLDYLLLRCTSQHEDGDVCGYRALTYYFRHKEYVRARALRGDQDGAGLAGAFGKLLQDHHHVRVWLDKRIRPAQGAGYREAGLTLASIHGEFLDRLRAAGVEADAYPFSQSRAGYGALSHYVRTQTEKG